MVADMKKLQIDIIKDGCRLVEIEIDSINRLSRRSRRINKTLD